MTDALHAPARLAMDDMYRRQRFIYDATRRYYLIGRDAMLAELRPLAGSAILEVGCGTARNLILAARRHPDVRLYGFDISTEMLKSAARSVAASGFENRISLAEGDATDFSGDKMFGVGAFDRIYVSYALSMIPQWQAVLDCAASQLADGGSLHVVDFGAMDRMPAVARRGMLSWLARFSVTPRRDLEAVAADVARRHGLALKFRNGRFDYSAHAILSRSTAL